MMKKILIVITATLLAGTTWLIVIAQPQTPSLKIQWMSDAVYYTTNTMVWDEERNKNLLTNSAFWYTKTVIKTNKVGNWYFRFGDRNVELGAREDGVIVWRYSKQ